jgi:hypothetical protein
VLDNNPAEVQRLLEREHANPNATATYRQTLGNGEQWDYVDRPVLTNTTSPEIADLLLQYGANPFMHIRHAGKVGTPGESFITCYDQCVNDDNPYIVPLLAAYDPNRMPDTFNAIAQSKPNFVRFFNITRKNTKTPGQNRRESNKLTKELDKAVYDNDVLKVLDLLHYVNVNAGCTELWGSWHPFLHYALKNPSMLEYLLKCGVDVNALHKYGTSSESLLCYAVEHHPEVLPLLISRGADVNGFGARVGGALRRCLPLTWAPPLWVAVNKVLDCEAGSWEYQQKLLDDVKFLLDHGANKASCLNSSYICHRMEELESKARTKVLRRYLGNLSEGDVHSLCRGRDKYES